MKFLAKILVVGALAVAAAAGAMAQEQSTAAEATSWLRKAQQYIKANGVEEAYVEFNRLESPFNSENDINKTDDLYLFTTDYTGLQTAHGKNPKILGKIMIDMRAYEGVYLIEGLIEKCKSAEGKGWVD